MGPQIMASGMMAMQAAMPAWMLARLVRGCIKGLMKNIAITM